MAGRGKSTIARTIARAYYGKKQLGASFFFSRGDSDVSELAKFFTTIAVQLASSCPSLEPSIARAVRENKNIANETLRDQWGKLIFQPLLSLSPEDGSTPSPLVIVVDALDECASFQSADQIVRLFSEAINITTVTLRILITSRPETPIRASFRTMVQSTYESLALDDIGQSVVDQDIYRFFEDRFQAIAQGSDGLLPLDWPGKTKIRILVQKADGLFIYAATICRFIQQKRGWSPRTLLEFFLPGEHDDRRGPGTRRLPLASLTAELDAVYLTVLEQSMSDNGNTGNAVENDASQSYFKMVMGSLVLLFEPLSTKALANLLGEREDDIRAMLCSLRSVLHVPEKNDEPVRLLHPSFRDFITSKERCTRGKYQLDQPTVHRLLMDHCLRRLSCVDNGLKKDICDLVHPGVPSWAVDADLIARRIPSDMKYACAYWIRHLIAANTLVGDSDWPHQFVKEHFLHWLEALCLLDIFDERIGALFDLDIIVVVSFLTVVPE
jgi:hypothetical protein